MSRSADTFDPSLQTRHDGPITDDFRKRIISVKERNDLTFANIATRAMISSSELSVILRKESKDRPNFRTYKAQKLSEVLERLDISPPKGKMDRGSQDAIESHFKEPPAPPVSLPSSVSDDVLPPIDQLEPLAQLGEVVVKSSPTLLDPMMRDIVEPPAVKTSVVQPTIDSQIGERLENILSRIIVVEDTCTGLLEMFLPTKGKEEVPAVDPKDSIEHAIDILKKHGFDVSLTLRTK